jgi:iron complex outermembrane receptor protein
MMPPPMRPARLACLLLATLVFAAAPARADKRDDAKKHFQSGKKHHDTGEWDAALEEYLAAYQLDPNPAFLFNIGQVYRLKGDAPKALDYYQRYLEAAPNAKGSAEARAYAEKIKAELDAAAAAARAQQEAEARRAAEAQRAERAAEEARQQQLEAERRAAEAARVAAAEQRQRAERRLRVAGVSAAAAGAVGIALGVKFGLDARDRERQVSDQSLKDWTTTLDQAVDDGKSKNLAMEISVGIGAALLVAGGALLVLGWPRRETTVTPTVGSNGAGAAVGWEF